MALISPWHLNIAFLYFFIMSEFSLAFYREGGHFMGWRNGTHLRWGDVPEKGGFHSQSLIFRPHRDTRAESGDAEKRDTTV